MLWPPLHDHVCFCSSGELEHGHSSVSSAELKTQTLKQKAQCAMVLWDEKSLETLTVGRGVRRGLPTCELTGQSMSCLGQGDACPSHMMRMCFFGAAVVTE